MILVLEEFVTVCDEYLCGFSLLRQFLNCSESASLSKDIIRVGAKTTDRFLASILSADLIIWTL